MDLDDAVRLLDDFLDAEWAAIQANYGGPDDELDAAVRAADRFFRQEPGRPMYVEIGRQAGLPPERLAELRESLPGYRRRVPLAVAEHDHPRRGRVFAGYVTSVVASPHLRYDRMIWLQEVDGTPYVVAIWVTDRDRPGMAFTHFAGPELGDPGPVLGVRRLAEPTDPASLEHWRSLGARA